MAGIHSVPLNPCPRRGFLPPPHNTARRSVLAQRRLPSIAEDVKGRLIPPWRQCPRAQHAAPAHFAAGTEVFPAADGNKAPASAARASVTDSRPARNGFAGVVGRNL